MLDAYGKRLRLGELLLKAQLLNREQIVRALELQKPMGLRVGQILLKLGYITEETLGQSLATQLNIPFVDLDRVRLDCELVRSIPEAYAKRHIVLAIGRTNHIMAVAMSDPTDLCVHHDLETLTGLRVEVVVAARTQIVQAVNRAWGTAGRTEDGRKPEPPTTASANRDR